MTVGPSERHPRAAHRPAGEFLESPEEPAVAEVREAREVITAFVDLLDEGSLGVDEAGGLQNPEDFLDTAEGVHNVFEDSLHNDAIKEIIGERKIMGIANQHGAGAKHNVCFDKFDGRNAREQDVESFPFILATDD